MIPLDHQQSNRWLQTAHEEEDAAVPPFPGNGSEVESKNIKSSPLPHSQGVQELEAVPNSQDDKCSQDDNIKPTVSGAVRSTTLGSGRVGGSRRVATHAHGHNTAPTSKTGVWMPNSQGFFRFSPLKSGQD